MVRFSEAIKNTDLSVRYSSCKSIQIQDYLAQIIDLIPLRPTGGGGGGMTVLGLFCLFM